MYHPCTTWLWRCAEVDEVVCMSCQWVWWCVSSTLHGWCCYHDSQCSYGERRGENRGDGGETFLLSLLHNVSTTASTTTTHTWRVARGGWGVHVAHDVCEHECECDIVWTTVGGATALWVHVTTREKREQWCGCSWRCARLDEGVYVTSVMVMMSSSTLHGVVIMSSDMEREGDDGREREHTLSMFTLAQCHTQSTTTTHMMSSRRRCMRCTCSTWCAWAWVWVWERLYNTWWCGSIVSVCDNRMETHIVYVHTCTMSPHTVHNYHTYDE